MNCTSLSLYTSSVHVWTTNTFRCVRFRINTFFPTSHCVMSSPGTLVWSRVYSPFSPSKRFIHENTSMRLCLIYYTTIREVIISLSETTKFMQISANVIKWCRWSSWFDMSSFLWRLARHFPECLNRTWSDAISLRFESMIENIIDFAKSSLT